MKIKINFFFYKEFIASNSIRKLRTLEYFPKKLMFGKSLNYYTLPSSGHFLPFKKKIMRGN